MSPWQEVLVFFAAIIGIIGFIALCCVAPGVLAYLSHVRDYRTAIRRINMLTQDIIHMPMSSPTGETDLQMAVRDRLVEFHSVKGNGLESATVDIEPLTKNHVLRLLTGLGLTFVSNKAHQSMVVREDTHITLEKRQTFEVPVTCLNFHKAVPTPQNDFIAIEEASPLVRAVLAVAKNAQVGPFVTQLAVWRETDNVDPQVVAIGRRFDNERRKANKLEARLSEAVVKKAHELVGA